MSKREKHPKLIELEKQGKTVYSISRLDTFNRCEYDYYLTYILNDRGEDNCYSLAGTRIHNNLEALYNNKIDEEFIKTDFENMLLEFELNGIDFPNEKIRENWVKDMTHFVNNVKKINKKAITEQFILYEIDKDMWVQGYIDIIFPDEDGKGLLVGDWKTSSEFKGKRLQEMGRQLLLYAMALESMTNKKVNNTFWYMIKYVNVTWNDKTKMLRRRDWVNGIRSELEKDISKFETDDFIIELLLDKAVADNNLKELPVEIQNKYKIKPAIVWYKPTRKRIEECKKYIVNTIKKIESKGKDENEYININNNLFFCNNLCNHRNQCKYRQ